MCACHSLLALYHIHLVITKLATDQEGMLYAVLIGDICVIAQCIVLKSCKVVII